MSINIFILAFQEWASGKSSQRNIDSRFLHALGGREPMFQGLIRS